MPRVIRHAHVDETFTPCKHASMIAQMPCDPLVPCRSSSCSSMSSASLTGTGTASVCEAPSPWPASLTSKVCRSPWNFSGTCNCFKHGHIRDCNATHGGAHGVFHSRLSSGVSLVASMHVLDHPSGLGCMPEGLKPYFQAVCKWNDIVYSSTELLLHGLVLLQWSHQWPWSRTPF